MRKMIRCRRGAALVEYGLLVAGVALMTTAAVAIFGHKTNDLMSTVASILPGAHPDDNNPIESGKIVETTVDATSGAIEVDVNTIIGNSDTQRLGNNIGVDLSTVVIEASEGTQN